MKYIGIIMKLLDDDHYYYCITRYVKLLVTYMIKNDSLIRAKLSYGSYITNRGLHDTKIRNYVNMDIKTMIKLLTKMVE